MELGFLDVAIFISIIVFILIISLYQGRKEETGDDYFLAGRDLGWALIGFSLIASNISTEHFVGQAGKGYDIGLAIASFEWMAAVTLVIVALVLLPRFLKSGITTMPEYLEYRYNTITRTIMAFYMMLAYIIVAVASVLYAGALALNTMFGIELIAGVWMIGIFAGIYTVYGGLKAVVWSDLFQGAGLLLGGLFVLFLGVQAMGGIELFLEEASSKLHTILPWDHPEMPWVAVILGGLWIPNLFYWGLNQFITQRALGARNVAEGQKGVLFGATLKLLIPFIVVFPGIIAFHLYGNAIPKPDMAYPYLLRELIPIGFRGAMLAFLFGAIVSSLDSMLNSASTIFTVDFYKRYVNPKANQPKIVRVGRITTALLAIIGCIWAPMISQFESVFFYIQKFWGFIMAGIVASFLFGMWKPKAPPKAAIGAMLINPIVYGFLLWFLPEISFLHHQFIALSFILLYMAIVTKLEPLEEPRKLPVNKKMDLKSAPKVKLWGFLIIAATAGLYIIFR